MTYDTVATICQVASLLMFIGMFAGRAGLCAEAAERTTLRARAARALDLDRSTDRESAANDTASARSMPSPASRPPATSGTGSRS